MQLGDSPATLSRATLIWAAIKLFGPLTYLQRLSCENFWVITVQGLEVLVLYVEASF